MLKSMSKAIAGGLGAAIAKTVTVFLPDLDPTQQQAIEYLIFTALTGLAVYVAPANAPSA